MFLDIIRLIDWLDSLGWLHWMRLKGTEKWLGVELSQLGLFWTVQTIQKCFTEIGDCQVNFLFGVSKFGLTEAKPHSEVTSDEHRLAHAEYVHKTIPCSNLCSTKHELYKKKLSSYMSKIGIHAYFINLNCNVVYWWYGFCLPTFQKFTIQRENRV